MAEYLKLKKSNCVNCYKCIRHCPVKSIKYSTGQAQIVNDECILCGQCFVVCPQNAKEIRNDVPSAINLLKSGPCLCQRWRPPLWQTILAPPSPPWKRP